jgi:hypothetical protein
MSRPGARANPFSSDRFSPGALPWISEAEEELESFTRAVCNVGARFQIVGPHGSGKSTLLVHLERRARKNGWSVVRVRASRQRLALPPAEQRLLVLVDEVEALNAFRRRVVIWRCAIRRAALVVTAHRDLGLPTLTSLCVDARVARAAVAALLADSSMPRLTADALEQKLARHANNLREVLFELYDDFEALRASRSKSRS